MKFPILALASIVTTANAQEKATVEWIPESAKATPGQPFRTVVRMQVDKGWHTYWENPGEGGLPISVKAELPEGWIIGKILFPAPIAFKTGPLSGFGYEGEIHFPLTITPPAGSEATEIPASIVPKITWLTCDDSACIPGKAEPTLSAPQPEPVAKAYAALPEEIPGATLSSDTTGGKVKLTLTLPAHSKVDPSACTVFPVTRNIIDPSAKTSFGKDGGKANTWTASAPKSEYLDGTPDTLSLVLVDTAGKAWAVSTGVPTP